MSVIGQKVLNDMAKAYKGLNIHKMYGALNLTNPNKISGARGTMFAGSHIDQFTMLKNPESPKTFTAAEKIYGKYADSYYKLPTDCEVIDVIPKYPTHVNYKYIVVVRDFITNEYDVIEVSNYESLSEKIGYERQTRDPGTMFPGMPLSKGSILYKSASHDENMNYRYGVNASTAYMSLPEVEEDGMKISESFAKNVNFFTVETKELLLNLNDVLLNMYGNHNTYKSFPNIGEYVEEGMLAVRRKINNFNAASEYTSRSLSRTSSQDHLFYGSGKIVDIDIFINNVDELHENDHRSQLALYYTITHNYYENINKVLSKIKSKKQNKYSYKLNALHEEAKNYLDDKVKFSGSSGPFEFAMLKITTLKENCLHRGYKVTDRYGGKGVICNIEKDENMPMTKSGKRADIVVSPPGVVGRANIGQLYEHALNYAGDKLVKKIKKKKTLEDKFKLLYEFINSINLVQADSMLEYFSKLSYEKKEKFIEDTMETGIYIHQPPFNGNISYEGLKKLFRKYHIVPEKVFTRKLLKNGRVRLMESINPIIIADKYVIILKHTTESKFSVRSIGTCNQMGIPSKSGKNEKIGPYSDTPIKFGDMELFLALSRVPSTIVHRFIATHGSNPKYSEKLGEMLLTSDPFEAHNLPVENEEILDDIPALELQSHLMSIGFELREVPRVNNQIGKLTKPDDDIKFKV